jgi:hypothetical protein
MTKVASAKKWRRINPYICEHCGKKRMSLKYDRAAGKTCTACKRKQPPKDQAALGI